MKKAGIFLLILIFLTSFSVAKISLSETNPIYNLGDKLYITTTIVSNSETGNFNLDLICGGNTINLQKISARRFPVGEEYVDSLPYKELTPRDLEIQNTSQILGECHVLATLGEEEASTEKFTITDEINLNAKLNKAKYNPGEAITLEINAIKANGRPLNGFLRVTESASFSKAVEEGKAKEIFAMPETTESGEYEINVTVYDELGNQKLNQESQILKFKINQIPSFIETTTSSNEIMPGKELKIKTTIYDQSGKEMDGNIQIKLIPPTGQEIQKSIKSKNSEEIKFKTNSTPGSWIMQAQFQDIFEEKEFYVQELQKADFEFIDTILQVKNIGNVIYNKTINIKIGEKTETLKLNIQPGETRKFNLNAPSGQYDVLVTDNDVKAEKTMLLTGNAISIKGLDDFSILSFSVLWILIILAISGIAIFFIFKYKSKTKKLTSKLKKANFFSKNKPAKEEKEIIDPNKNKSNAESTLVLKGQKTPATILSVKLENFSELSEEPKKQIEKIIESAKDHKGSIDWKDEGALIIYSPLVTKTYKNEILAAKTAVKIKLHLEKYNKKYVEKVKFSLGIHTGDIIATKDKNKLKYTGVENTISLAKKISDTSDSKIIMSDKTVHKIGRAAKTERSQQLGKTNTYELKELREIEQNQEKLRQILKRMDKDKK